ncbi:MAG: DUF4870 domain-containing protein [Nitriliruptoraceae bacterium]
MTCPTCGAIVDTMSPTCQLCGTPVPRADAPASGDPSEGAGPPSSTAAPGTGGASPGTGRTAAGTGLTAGAAAGGATPPPPNPGAPGWAPPQPHPSGLSSELRGWAIAAHLGGLIIGLATAAVFGFVGPLLVWLFKRDEHPFTDHHAKESLNFQLTVLMVLVIAVALAIPGLILGVLTLGIGLVLLGVLAVVAAVAWVVLPIIGAVKASNGEGYRYPLTIRFIS